MRRLVIPAILAALPAPAALAAGPAWVTNTEVCAALGAGTPPGEVLGETDVLFLDAQAITGMEYHCAFEPALDLGAPDLTITTHLGYCEEPGLITPQLFTFRIERLETPRATLYDGSETPTVFFACP